MKWIILAVFLIPSVVFAECRVIEYEDRSEVDCNGTAPTDEEIQKKEKNEQIEKQNIAVELFNICKINISSNLKAPATAIYSVINKNNPIYYFYGNRRIKISVDAQNGYGALIREYYECTFDDYSKIKYIEKAAAP